MLDDPCCLGVKFDSVQPVSVVWNYSYVGCLSVCLSVCLFVTVMLRLGPVLLLVSRSGLDPLVGLRVAMTSAFGCVSGWLSPLLMRCGSALRTAMLLLPSSSLRHLHFPGCERFLVPRAYGADSRSRSYAKWMQKIFRK